MSEDKQDKIISLLSQITKQNQTEIDNQKHLINNQVSLSSVIMNAQNKIVNGLNEVLESINRLSANYNTICQHSQESHNTTASQSNIADSLNGVKKSIDENDTAIRQCIKDNGSRIVTQALNDAKSVLNQLTINGNQIKLNGRHVYDDFAMINVIAHVLPDLLYLGSDIYAATNSVARKQGAMFYTNFANPGGYRQAGTDFRNTLNNNEYYTNDDNN